MHDDGGRQVFRWNPGETVTAMAYDNPIPGFGTNNTINLRLWAAKPDREFDLQAFNTEVRSWWWNILHLIAFRQQCSFVLPSQLHLR